MNIDFNIVHADNEGFDVNVTIHGKTSRLHICGELTKYEEVNVARAICNSAKMMHRLWKYKLVGPETLKELYELEVIHEQL